MKIEFNENKWGVMFELQPETPAEVAQLLRFVNNAKAEKPSVYMSFSTDKHYCNVSMSKIKDTVQSNSISPKRK